MPTTVANTRIAWAGLCVQIVNAALLTALIYISVQNRGILNAILMVVDGG